MARRTSLNKPAGSGCSRCTASIMKTVAAAGFALSLQPASHQQYNNIDISLILNSGTVFTGDEKGDRLEIKVLFNTR